MKHAVAASLDRAAPLLAELRATPGLREKQPGVFYRGGRAWLHFHEDGAALWVDLKHAGDWLRLPADTTAQWRTIAARLRDSMEAS